MFTSRRLLSSALLISLASLAGCSLLPGGPEPGGARLARGGFTVLVDGPGRPTAAGVAADIGAFAQGRGYARQATRPAAPADPASHEPAPVAPERYLSGGITLEVTRLPVEHRVSAYLRNSGSGNDAKVIERFYRDFVQEYAGRYGGADRISETAYDDDTGRGGTSLFGKPVQTGPNAGSTFGNGT